MNTAVINSLPEKHNFDSKIKEVSESASESKLNDKSDKIIQNVTKEEPPALHVLAESCVKTAVSSSQCVTATNVKSSTRVVPLVYIQAPANLKVPSSITSTGNSKSNPQIIVNANNQFQISTLSTKLKANTTMSSVVLTQTGTNSKSQPIILQKTANSSNAQTLIPVTVATSTGTKQTFAYLGTIIKPPGAKTSENQIVVPTSHLPAGLVPAPTNQKLVLTSMAMPKLTPRVPITCSTTNTTQTKLSSLILPMSLSTQLKNATNQSVINFKISNGQIQSDPKGCISVLCDGKSADNNNEPNKDKAEFKVTTNSEMKDTKSVKSGDLPLLAPKPAPKKDKSLTEKVYELSIPEVPSKCELSYTISIPDEKTKMYKPFITRTVTTEPKDIVEDILGNVQSIVPKQEPHPRKSLHEVSILKKCNLNSVDRKSDIMMKKPILPKPEPTEIKTETVENDSKLEVKPQTNSEVRKVNPERRRKSQYTYLRDFDEVVVTSGNAWENKNNTNKQETKLKQFQSAEITFTKLPAADDESKENVKKSLDDFIEIEVVKQDLPQFTIEDDQDIKTVLKWRDGIGFLPGSKLKFHINEFGIIEMLVAEEFEKLKSIKKEEDGVNGSEEILCCSECGCHGMPSEFISNNFCSKECKLSAIKSETKRAYLQDMKAKRKKKKLAMLQKHKSEEIIKTSEDTPPIINPASDDDNDQSNDMLNDKARNYPWQAGKKGFSWSKYLEHVKGKAAPVKLFKDPFPYAKNGFRPGMKLEGIDPQHPSYFCVMTVSEVQGYRIRLHFDGYPDNFDFWVNADSMDIFPVGWCEKYNHVLHPPPSYAPNDFNWTSYLKQCKATAAPRHLFANRAGNSVCPNGFRLGMKLEAVDKKNTSLVCVATVTDLMDNRFLVHFDSWDDIYDYWADPTSPYIHPVGWCDQFGHNLTPPNGKNDYPDPETFTWEKYLKETKSSAAPVRAFKQRPSTGFKKDMRLEVVDKRVPALIRVATVEDVRDHQIKVRFDGWPNKYSFWIDDDSPDIHPASWSQKTGHPLESPLTPEDVYENFECPTVGCRGVGHIQGPKYITHSTSKDCPYSDENLDPEFVLPDRLNLTYSDFTQESVVPVSREPRENRKPSRMGRPTKIRRLTETSIKQEWSAEDELSDSSRKRKISVNRESMSSPLLKEENHRFKSLSDFPSCPSQQVLAKHSKILNEIISSNSKDPRSWTIDEVTDFVNSLPSCKEHSKLFVTHKIDGEAFLMLTQRDLVDILKFKLGPAIKLYNSIVLLRQNVNFYN